MIAFTPRQFAERYGTSINPSGILRDFLMDISLSDSVPYSNMHTEDLWIFHTKSKKLPAMKIGPSGTINFGSNPSMKPHVICLEGI